MSATAIASCYHPVSLHSATGNCVLLVQFICMHTLTCGWSTFLRLGFFLESTLLAQVLLLTAQACASVTESEGAFSISHVFCQRLPPSLIAKPLCGVQRHQPRICLRLILVKTVLFLEPHCPLSLSLDQSNFSADLIGLPGHILGNRLVD